MYAPRSSFSSPFFFFSHFTVGALETREQASKEQLP